MNSSTLRRLASDHSSLHKSQLPPYYLFPAANGSSSVPDDLTQLTILMTGPQGTPYAQGLWKLCLKIPEDYPKSPPKAAFRTRIWHPNVEENTGNVCVDTLKRDWDSRLTLRDILITISCLLIHPNPDSALNSAAGHLLQDDYDSFARQAKLMTSIHARIPPNLKDAVLAAKRRGEVAGMVTKEDLDERPSTKRKASSSSSVVMKKKTQAFLSPSSGVPANGPSDRNDNSDEDAEDEASASKENDPSQSPSPVTVQSPRRPALTKRPLSDLPIPIEPELDDEDASGLSPSELNIANNTPSFSNHLATTLENSCQNLKLAERSRSINFSTRGLQDASKDGLAIVPLDIKGDEPEDHPIRKRLCLWDGKENSTHGQGVERSTAPATRPAPGGGAMGITRPAAGTVTKPDSASIVGGKGGRPRIGLRRL